MEIILNLNPNGFVKRNTKVEENDIIIGKVMPIKNDQEYDYRDSSTGIKKNEMDILMGIILE